MLDVTITAPADVQAEEADAWDLAQMWAEFRAELEITGEQAEEVYRNLRGLRQYGPARVVAEPPGGVLWLKCARRFKKGGRSEPT